MRAETAPGRSDRRLLLFVLLNILLANVTFKLIAHFVFHTGVEEMRDRYMDFLHFRQFTDSWRPMLGSVNSFLTYPGLPPSLSTPGPCRKSVRVCRRRPWP